MKRLGQNIRRAVRTIPPKIVVAGIAFAVMAVGLASAAVLPCMLESYAQPEKLALGLVTALEVARIVVSVWFGIRLIS